MSEWALAKLDADNWTYRQPDAPPPTLGSWAPATWPRRLLSESFTIVPPRHRLDRWDPMASPSDVDAVTGAVRSAKPANGRPGFRLADLRPGDTLVPSLGQGPCVFVTPEFEDITFSATFHVLRALDGRPNVAVWAWLSSAAGVSAREALEARAAAPRLPAAHLLTLTVPWLPESKEEGVRTLLPRPPVHELARVREASAWKLVPLTGADDWLPRSSFRSLFPGRTVPLGEIANVWSGNVKKFDLTPVEVPSALPVVTRRDVVARCGPSAWARPSKNLSMTDSSTVLVTLSGRFAISVAPAKCLVESGVAGISVTDSAGDRNEVARRLAAFLQSAAGQFLLREASRGTAMPSLTLSGLRQLQVPPPTELPRPDDTQEPLAERLDATLRTF